MRLLRSAVLRLLDRTRSAELPLTLLTAGLIGVLGALCTIGFRMGIEGAEQLVYGEGGGLVRIASHLPLFWRLVTPALGGVLGGLALAWARRLSHPDGSSDYMESIALGNGRLAVRSSLGRALSSALVVASGGAIGREGSMVQLSALAGSLVGRWRRAPMPRLRLMVACGAAAGVATAYNAPVAGALFVAEIVLHSVAIESLGPLIVSAVTAHLTLTRLFGLRATYHMPPIEVPDGSATLVLAGLGLLAGVGAPLYRAVLDQGHHLFARWTAPLWLKLGAGGLVVGALSLLRPEVWGNGYSVVNDMLQGHWLWQALLVVLLLKLVAVAATTGSGAVGGIFTPTLFVGAAAGGLFSTAVQALSPGLIAAPVCVATGMGAFLAAATHAPLTSILMIFEMTENYGLMMPLMLSCVLGYTVSRVIRPDSIYSDAAGQAQPTPAVAIATDFLRTDAATIAEGASLQALEQVFVRHRRPHVYVLDAREHFLGAISLHDLNPLTRSAHDEKAAWPPSLLRTDFPSVRADMPVWQVLETFATHPGERLPVLDAERRLLGYVTKSDLVLMFRERLSQLP